MDPELDRAPLPHALDYAPPPKWYRGIAWGRWIKRALVAAILLSPIWWGPGVWRRSAYMYYQGQSEAATPPAGTGVLDSSAPTRPPLPTPHSDYWRSLRWTHGAYPTAVVGTPVALQRMRTAGGTSRIVGIYAVWSPNGLQLHSFAAATRSWPWVFWPGNRSRRPMMEELDVARFSAPFAPTEHVLVQAAQPDPKNPARLLIPYSVDGQNGIIRAWFLDRRSDPTVSGIYLEPVSGPLTQRGWGTGGSVGSTDKPVEKP